MSSQKGFAPIFILIGLIILGALIFGGYLYFNKSKVSQSEQVTSKLFSPVPSATALQSSADESSSIKIPFVRDGSIYLYEDGKEKLIAKPQQVSTETSCYNVIYPFLSPNGKYVAYIEQTGGEPGYGGCPNGLLKIANLETGEIKATSYKVGSFKWNSANQIVFKSDQERDGVPQPFTSKEVFYDPASGKGVVFSTVISQDKVTYADTMISAEYPFDANKLVRYEDNKYYLIDKAQNRKDLLFEQKDNVGFTGWSPDGTYVIFTVNKPGLDSAWVSINTSGTDLKPKNILVKNLAGGAGGDVPAGPKWYFNKAFLLDCQQELFFVDGITTPLELTHTGGGGCHNSEGFVSTSPNGQYAFVKFEDRFELHTQNGEKTTIKELSPLERNRYTPKNLIWINNDYMAIFERSAGGDYGTGKSPRIFLFDRKANLIKPIVENAYLN